MSRFRLVEAKITENITFVDFGDSFLRYDLWEIRRGPGLSEKKICSRIPVSKEVGPFQIGNNLGGLGLIPEGYWVSMPLENGEIRLINAETDEEQFKLVKSQ